MNFNLDQLRSFEAILRLGSFSAAAKVIGVSQSSLSQQVARLGSQCGSATRFRRLGEDHEGYVSTLAGPHLDAPACLMWKHEALLATGP